MIARVHSIGLANVTFHVNESGRQRVLRDKCKNVHAYVIGDWTVDAPIASYPKHLSYNPYASPYFTHDGQPVHSAAYAVLNADGLSARFIVYRDLNLLH